MCGFIGVFEDSLLAGCERDGLDRMNRIGRIPSHKRDREHKDILTG